MRLCLDKGIFGNFFARVGGVACGFAKEICNFVNSKKNPELNLIVSNR